MQTFQWLLQLKLYEKFNLDEHGSYRRWGVHSHQATPSQILHWWAKKVGIQPILPVTVTVKKIKGVARQCYGDGDEVIQCEQALRITKLQQLLTNKYAFQ